MAIFSTAKLLRNYLCNKYRIIIDYGYNFLIRLPTHFRYPHAAVHPTEDGAAGRGRSAHRGQLRGPAAAGAT